jgi:NADP-dependent 3-hydroxy acid dehydrogenase YdfG
VSASPPAAPAPASPGRPVALVTGASRGIGRAVAVDLGRTHHVLVGGRDADAVAAVVDTLPSAEPWLVDLADDAALDAAAARIDRLDVLVNNAGVADERPFLELTRDDWRRSFEVNVFAVAELTRRCLPALRAARGLVVMMNSGSGFMSYPGGAVYTGTKFALRTMADCLREEERGHGVRVTSVHPGFVDTDMGRGIRAQHGVPDDAGLYVAPPTIAAGVRLAVDAPPEAQVETLSIRPARLA